MSENKKRLWLIILTIIATTGLCIVMFGIFVGFSPVLDTEIDSTIGEMFFGSTICCFTPGILLILFSLAVWFLFINK